MFFSPIIALLAGTQLLNAAAIVTPRTPTQSRRAIIQMFEWTWDSIASECSFIGAAGYGFVQVSPPAEHITGSQWWTDYQPVSYTLTSKRGNRSQFASMVTACHAAGVSVIADTLFNHMSAQSSGTGIGGDSYTKYVYPGIYQYQDFHHVCGEANGQISNYNNRTEVQFCELVGLADLATETEYVRARLATYGNDLISLGVDGFRLDASKHIPAADISNILSRLSKTVYITQEVIWGSGEPIQPSEYVGNGDVQEFRYTSALQSSFGSSSISGLSDINSRGWVASSSANVFVANHDTERGGSSLNSNSANNAYVLATIFSLSFPYGTPSVLSSYTYSTVDDGAPNGGAGTCSGTGGSNGWLCQHRWIAFTGMVSFFNNVTGTALTNWASSSSSQIAFGRGSAGFVAINSGSSSWTSTFTTSLPNGVYCNVINGAPSSSGTCVGTTITVSGGTFTATVTSYNAIALHTGAKSGTVSTAATTTTATATTATTTTTTSASTATAVTVTFDEYATTVYGENIFVVGSISQLGSWAPASAIALSSAAYPTWAVSVSVPPATTFQYKYIRKSSTGVVTWESDPNRSYTSPSSGSASTSDSWR